MKNWVVRKIVEYLGEEEVGDCRCAALIATGGVIDVVPLFV